VVQVAVLGFVLTAFLLTLRDGFQFHWVRYWQLWIGLVVVGALVGLTQLRGTECAAGVDWLRGRRQWVRTYELVKVKSYPSFSGGWIRLEDRDGRTLGLDHTTLQQDRRLWNLVYNGILHSVIAGGAETNGAAYLHLHVPYPSPYDV
jgi:hypothetical protein